jgi:hypothetical protein
MESKLQYIYIYIERERHMVVLKIKNIIINLRNIYKNKK